MAPTRHVLAIALVLAVGACGDDDDESPVAEGLEVTCGDVVFDYAALREAPSIDSLPEGPAGAVDDAGGPVFDLSADWHVVRQSDERVDLIRELEVPHDQGAADIRTHEAVTLERVTDIEGIPDGTWMAMSVGLCTPRLPPVEGLADADLALATLPSPDDRSLDLLVHERGCASGSRADGRVELVQLEETAEQVRLRIGVRPLEGGQECPGNPPTEYSVQLSEPLGDREIVDASIVPRRKVDIIVLYPVGESAP